MRDAFGGVANLAIIIVFLTLVSGYLALNVNYTKAFRVKNKIISTIEEYEGNCKIEATNPCHLKIQDYMNSLGYNAPYLDIKNGTGKNVDESENQNEWDCGNGAGYCIKEVPINDISVGNAEDTKKRSYFKVVTQINIDIPIVNRILPKIFEVRGDTKPIVIKSGS
jgi:hypothetical protein